jgi:predicted HTH transcriptional regulator
MTELPWEDALLERKLEADQKDFLKTFVAFANSVRPGHIAVVLIGEKNDGSVQGVSNPRRNANEGPPRGRKNLSRYRLALDGLPE